MDRRHLLSTALAAGVAAGAPALARPARGRGPRSAIFLHPDGMGANTWMAVRLKEVGPDGRLAWDRLPAAAVYVGPMRDAVTASSRGGATTHAWGLRADRASFGTVGGVRPARSASGFAGPLMAEARAAGKAIGLVNSASITEAGTGAMLASSAARDEADIAAQLLAARPQIMLGGGEGWFLPTGTMGRHGPGRRTDGRDLLAEARAAGVRLVFDARELAEAPVDDRPLLGLFATGATYEDVAEADLVAGRARLFVEGAPSWDVMVAAAIARLSRAPKGHFLVANHETTDDLAGDNNAAAVLTAGAQADRAVAAALAAVERDPGLTLIVASDSDCGGLVATGDDAVAGQVLPTHDENGAPIDGDGALRTAFLAAPDRAGKRLPFRVQWAASGDVSGGVVVRAKGPGAARVMGTMDSTDIFTALHAALFGEPARR
jgi:alkaline phosphatase